MRGTARYSASDLIIFTRRLFASAGCDGDKPQLMAELLVEADLMGHTTHGLQLASSYLDEIEAGSMTATGDVVVVSDRGPVVTWDGRMLPGVWLTARAIDLGIQRARRYGVCAIGVRRSHHIACLAAYLLRATNLGMMVMIASSDPSQRSVAPHGGLTAVFTPDPIAFGIPTTGEPILIDISSSITTNAMTDRLRREGARYPGNWAVTNSGELTDDPNALSQSPPGALLLAGGHDHGHKGYGWALAVEALTQALPGFGRADEPKDWGAGIFIQLFEPQAFSGFDAFIRETGWISDACRSCPPLPGVKSVRLPGQSSLAHRRDGLANGVQLHDGILDTLAPWAERHAISLPTPLG